MVGESYAGGIQYIASAKDKRLQALVPLTTWYDLSSTLSPNGIPKSGWLNLLNLANWWNWNRFDPAITQAYLESKKGKISFATHAFLKTHQARWFCENQQPPQADALLIQGFRDVLFPFNEALRAGECLQNAGRDVRIIGSNNGHLQPPVQHSPGLELPVWYLERTIHCHQQQFNVQQIIGQWFDAKLKDQTEQLAHIPTLCLENSPSRQLAELEPVDRYPFPELQVNLHKNLPLLVPLVAIQQNGWMSGVPRLTLNMQTDAPQTEPILFISMGVWKKNSTQYRILNEQTIPLSQLRLKQRNAIAQQLGFLPGKISNAVDLPAVNSALKKDEILGLVISSRNPYYGSTSQKRATTRIEGMLELPKIINTMP